jgi:hypothetical protein
MTTQTIILLIISVAFLTVLLILILRFPNPTASQFFIFRVILALAAAGIGAIIPGYLGAEGKQNEILFRAGGAILLFVLVYLVDPGIAKRLNLIKSIKTT